MTIHVTTITGTRNPLPPPTTHVIHGQADDWSETDYGHHFIYTADPDVIPASCAARVIYELRLDCDRLNSEVIAERNYPT